MKAQATEALKCRAWVKTPADQKNAARGPYTKPRGPSITLSPYGNPLGRKCKRLETETVARLRDALAAGNTTRTACAMAGISDKSLYRWLKEAESAPEGHELVEFRDTVKGAKAVAEHRNVMVIQEAAQKDWRAAAWFLERRWPKDYGRKRWAEAGGDTTAPLT